MNNKFSLIILTQNNKKINTITSWLDKCSNINEIIILNENFEENKISKPSSKNNLSIKQYFRNINNNFSDQRNFAVSKASNDWIIFFDTDEIPDSQLINFLNNFKPDKYQAYSFIRSDIFLNQSINHGESGKTRLVRLFNKNNGIFVGKVHEIWKTEGEICNTDFKIVHYPHPNLKSFWQKINFYSDIRAQELYDQKTPSNILSIIFYPLAKFIQDYIIRLGFLDGTAGLVLVLTMSFYSFLVRAKLWHFYQTSS